MYRYCFYLWIPLGTYLIFMYRVLIKTSLKIENSKYLSYQNIKKKLKKNWNIYATIFENLIQDFL